MCKILCFGRSAGSEFIEKYVAEGKGQIDLVTVPHLDKGAVLEAKPDLVLLTEPIIDRLLSNPFLQELESEHRFSIFSFLNKDDVAYRLKSYQVGAQDCLSLEMVPEELHFKMSILTRRTNLLRNVPPTIELKNMLIFPAYKRVLINNQEVRLANKEYEILLLLIKKREQFVTAAEIIASIWKGATVSQGNIYTQIHNLKRKIKNFDGTIASQYGVGFRLYVEPPSDS